MKITWERMYDATRDYGQKGTLIGAISGVDIALWDIKGKATGKPVHLASLPPCPPTGNPWAYYQEPVLEFDRNPSPLRDELSTVPIEFRGGMVWVPQGPGLGIEIDQDVLGRYRVA